MNGRHKHYSDPRTWPKGKRAFRVGKVNVTAVCRCGAVRLELAPRSIVWTAREDVAERVFGPAPLPAQ